MQNDWKNVFTFAKNLVLDGGEQIRSSFKDELTIKFKTNASDLVTNMDKQIEQFFINKIHEKYPSHRILGEEGQGDDVSSMNGTVWIIDPIDGTMNFVHMQRHFAISVGVYHNGVGIIGFIYDVAADDLFYAIKGEGAYLNDEKLPMLQSIDIGQAVFGINAAWGFEKERIDAKIIPALIKNVRGTRSFGSATIEMAYVAAGKLDGYLSLRLSPWDFAAGKIIVEEVGGKVSSVKGGPLDMLARQTPVFVAKPGLHEYILNNFFAKSK
ncbi:MAG TPA: inositol monophosphatase family protein [Bacillus bacterium]|nr:inositol monophosphatase family protein [Bacillus sp. (in: firmicutes)]